MEKHAAWFDATKFYLWESIMTMVEWWEELGHEISQPDVPLGNRIFVFGGWKPGQFAAVTCIIARLRGLLRYSGNGDFRWDDAAKAIRADLNNRIEQRWRAAHGNPGA